jgi:hypothetical protein
MSIEQSIYAYISTDATLLALLGGTAKIYPLKNTSGAAAPYIIYQLAAEGGAEELIDECRIVVKVVVDAYDYATAIAIRDRVNALLDLQDGIQSVIDGVLWCKKNGGGDLEDTDTEQVIKVVNFDLKYKRT